MFSYNKGIMAGKVANEVKLMQSKKGTDYCNIIIAVSYTNAQGEQCTNFNELMAYKNVAKFLAKDSEIKGKDIVVEYTTTPSNLYIEETKKWFKSNNLVITDILSKNYKRSGAEETPKGNYRKKEEEKVVEQYSNNYYSGEGKAKNGVEQDIVIDDSDLPF